MFGLDQSRHPLRYSNLTQQVLLEDLFDGSVGVRVADDREAVTPQVRTGPTGLAGRSDR